MTMWCTARSVMESTLQPSIHRKGQCRPTTTLFTALALVLIRKARYQTTPASALRELRIAELRDREPLTGSITRCTIVDRAAAGIPAPSMQGPAHPSFAFAIILLSQKQARIILSPPEMSPEFPEAATYGLVRVKHHRGPRQI